MSAGTKLGKQITAIKSERKLPGEEIPQVFQAFPWPLPFDPYSLPYSLMILMGQESHWPMFQPWIAAMLPCLVTEHLQPAGMTAASFRCLPIVAQLKAPIDSEEAAPPLAIQLHKLQNDL
jgi:hypothetical protein